MKINVMDFFLFHLFIVCCKPRLHGSSTIIQLGFLLRLTVGVVAINIHRGSIQFDPIQSDPIRSNNNNGMEKEKYK